MFGSKIVLGPIKFLGQKNILAQKKIFGSKNVGPQKLKPPKKLGQKSLVKVGSVTDIADIDKCCPDKCSLEGWYLLKIVQRTYL